MTAKPNPLPEVPENTGVPASPSGLRPFGAEPQDASQAKPLVPNAIARNELRRVHFALGGSPETLAAILAEERARWIQSGGVW